MRLEAFLRQPDWTEQRLADEVQRVLGRKLEVSPSTICRLKRGNGRRTQRTASVSLALALERATGGVVRAEELPLTRTSRRLLRDLRPTAERDSAGASAA